MHSREHLHFGIMNMVSSSMSKKKKIIIKLSVDGIESTSSMLIKT